jgi:hypothetical protein
MIDTSMASYVGFFPALPMTDSMELGEWCIGRPPQRVAWRSARFKSLAESLVKSFEKSGFRDIAMFWHRDRGFDGTIPSDAEIRAIQTGVRFSALDANDQVLSGLNVGHVLVTTENAELFLQPIDEEDGSIAHRTGGALKSVLTGGYKIGDGAIPLPDATVPILRPVIVSKKLAAALFQTLTTASAQSGHIRIALEWHAVAMSNPNAVTLQQRLIAIKTAFEALLGTSDSRDCARRLRALFETAAGPHLHLLPWAGVLWSPKERRDLVRQYTTRKGALRSDTRSELEDWFMTLTDARNSVIHDGVLSVTDYGPPQERPLSRYKGSLFWIGERLVREAIKASLGAEVLLCARLKEEASWAEFATLLREEHPDLANQPTAARDDQEKEPGADPGLHRIP